MTKKIQKALETAERFMCGFEDDEQQRGVKSQLALIRSAMAQAATSPHVIIETSGGVVQAAYSTVKCHIEVLDREDEEETDSADEKARFARLNSYIEENPDYLPVY